MKYRKYLILLIIFLLIFILTGCKKQDDTELLKQKVYNEINLLDDSLVAIINKLNNISYENYYITTEKVNVSSTSESEGKSSSNESSSNSSSQEQGESKTNEKSIILSNMKAKNILLEDKNDVDWDEIKTKIEKLYSSWNIIIMDLYKLGINNDDILRFSNYLDTLLSNIKQENKGGTLVTVANLYGILPIFMNSYSDNKSIVNVEWTKAHVINAYSAIGNNDWNTANKEIVQAEQSYSSIMTDINFVNQKLYNTNKTYVTLKELQNSLSMQDEDIFYIKYRNFMEEINIVTVHC